METIEAIDAPVPADSTKYLKNSTMVIKLYGAFLFFALFASFILRPMFPPNSALLDLLVGLPFLLIFILAPIGLFYNIKSHRRNEGKRLTRMKQTFTHLFVCVLLLLMITAFLMDISALLTTK